MRLSGLRLTRSAVGMYRTRLIGNPDRHCRDFLESRGIGSTLPPGKRADLTLAFRRYRDTDQSEAAVRLGYRLIMDVDPEHDVGNDVDFACLLLNACYLFRVQPPPALLNHVETHIAPKIRTAQQLEVIVAAFQEMAGAPRARNLLSVLVPCVDSVVGRLSRETTVFMMCALVDTGITPPLLIQALLERAGMVLDKMSFHEVAQLCLALAVSPHRPPDVKETLMTDFAPRIMSLIDFAMAQDVASVLYSFAEMGVAVPEMVAVCASRLYALHRDLDSDGVAMTFTALGLMELRAPKLTGALIELVKQLDLSSISALAALDMAHAMAFLGVEDEIALTLLTGRIMEDRQSVLGNPAARLRLVALSDRLVGKQTQPPEAPPETTTATTAQVAVTSSSDDA